MRRARAFVSRYRDPLLAGVAAVALVANTLGVDIDRDPPPALDALTAAAFALPLVWRRRHPLAAALTMMSVGLARGLWLTPPPDTALAIPILIVMMYSLGFYAESRRGVVGIVAASAIAIALASIQTPGDIFFPVAFFFVMPWAGGRAMRHRLELTRELAERAARVEHERDERAARAVADERARIARELHDVVAHSLTVMVIQAGAARRIVDTQPERVSEVAGTIRRMGREALDEMRRLVGVLREEGEGVELAPQPTMADLDALIERARGAGLEVELEVRGERAPLPPGVDLSAYRVIQEALTNTIKHARAERATVCVSYGESELELAVADDGAGGAAELPSGGHGLVGMRERVLLYGGELEAGPRAGGGFEVRARFPLRQEAYA